MICCVHKEATTLIPVSNRETEVLKVSISEGCGGFLEV
jgi:hypothetical protein